MRSLWQMSINLLSAPSEIQWQRDGQRLDFNKRFFLDANGDHGEAGSFRGLEKLVPGSGHCLR